MDGKVIWHQGLTFTGTAGTGFEVPLGAEAEVGGANDGFRPIELMAVSLSGCTAMDVLSILRKKQQEITGFEVRTHTDDAEDFPKVFTRIHITYLVTGHKVDLAAVLRSIELSVTKYCAAYAMISRVAPIEQVYEIYEDTGDGKTRLVQKGVYQPQPN